MPDRWNLFCLLPVLLFHKPSGDRKVSKPECAVDSICLRKATGVLWRDVVRVAGAPVHTHTRAERRGSAACRKVQKGEVTRAGAALALGDDTKRELQSRRPETVQSAIPREVLDWEPETPVQIDRKMFMKSLKTAPKGSSPGPGGCTHEHLRVLLDEVGTVELLLEAASSVAQAKVPQEIAEALACARLTALSKTDGGVRGIATGCSLRRLVARTLTKQFAEEFERECAPFQYALSTRAGTDCVGHMLRAACDADGWATVLSVDGIGAYDHVLRSAMLERLRRMPKARTILPFARLSYASSPVYSWWDENGEVHHRESGRRRGTRRPADAFAAQHRHPGRSGRGCGYSGSG